MAASNYRAGIIGLGFIGGGDQVSGDALGQQVADLDGTHLAALTKHSRVDLVAGSSRDEGRRQRFSERTSLPAYAEWRELIENENLDIVSIATYAPVHAEITAACAAAGCRAIYCEKPIATCLADAQRMVDACDQAGSILVINHNRRFQLNHRRLREHIAAGNLGDLTSAALQWSSGRLGNVGTHMFDALRMVSGREIRAVSGTLDLAGKPDCRGPEFSDPGGWGVMRLEGDFMATVDAMDYSRVPGSTIVNGTSGRALISGDEITLEYWDGTRDHWPDPNLENSGMDRAIAEIVDALDGNIAFPYPGVEGLRTLEAIVAFHASHARNAAWTELPLTGADRDIVVNSG